MSLLLSSAPATAQTVVSVSLPPTSVIGGNNTAWNYRQSPPPPPYTQYCCSGTVTLSGPAPSGGATITVTSDSPAAYSTTTVNGYPCIVSAGQTGATFYIVTARVSATTVAHITVAYNGSSQKSSLTITPELPLINEPATIVGGDYYIGTVNFNDNSTGSVALSSNSPVISVPASVTVTQYYQSGYPTYALAYLPITPALVGTATPVQLTATANGNSTMTTVQVLPWQRLDAGGGDYTDSAGNFWLKDQAFSGTTNVATTSSVINGTSDPALFQSQREGASFTYTLPAANGVYNLSLLFAEIEGHTQGQRVFGVSANGQALLSNYDIYADAGGANRAVVKTFPVTVTNGQLSLSFTGVTGNAAIAGFSLVSARFQITNIHNGDTLSGDVTVTVTVYDNSDGSDIDFILDGHDYGPEIVQGQPNGSLTISFDLNTNRFSNGSHIITVSDSSGHNDSRTITLSNVISNVNFDAIFDVTPGVTDVPPSSHISASLSSSQAWQVAIQDLSGNTVKNFTGTGNAISVTWDGTNTQGTVVSDGPYSAVITAPPGGNTSPSGNSPGAGAATGGSTTTQIINKHKIGDVLIILNPAVFVGGLPTVNNYAKFLTSLFTPKIGTDFYGPIDPIIVDKDSVEVQANRDRINNCFKQRLNLFYVNSHGGSGLQIQSGGKPLILGHPFFEIGHWDWYSNNPNASEANKQYNVPSLISNGIGYAGNPTSLVWIDTCYSASGGEDANKNYIADTQWGVDFGITGTSIGGAFLGWIDESGWYGAQLPRNFTPWTNDLWNQLFTYGQNFQTAITHANTMTPTYNFTHPRNPQDVEVTAGMLQSVNF